MTHAERGRRTQKNSWIPKLRKIGAFAAAGILLCLSAPVAAQVDLSLVFSSAPGTANVGSPVNYVLQVGGSGASNVWVTAVFNPPVTFTATNAANSSAGCVANIAPSNLVPPDPSATVTCPWSGSNVTVQVTPASVGALKVIAGVIANDPNPNNFDPNPTNNSALATTNVTGGAAPTILGISPPWGSTAGGTLVTVTGTNFASGASLKLGGSAVNVSSLSATQITGTTTSHAAGTVNIVVTNPDTQTATLTNGFVYQNGAKFNALTPCRVIDTRNANGPLGGPALAANSDRSFAVTGHCGIPADAQAISVNVTITQASTVGDLKLYSTGGPLPTSVAINYGTGQSLANNSIVPIGSGGAFTVHTDQPSGTVHLIVDVNGYYRGSASYQFKTLTPCRIVDTRNGTGGYTGLIHNGQTVSFPIRNAQGCGVPTAAVAVALNITVTNMANNGYVALFAADQAWSGISSINFNASQGSLANGAVVPLAVAGPPDVAALAAFQAGADGTNLILDVVGYFVATGGVNYYAISPCRAVDTQTGLGGFTGLLPNGFPATTFTIKGSCGVPTDAAAIAVNATTVSPQNQGWIALYPGNAAWPGISTVNFQTGITIGNGVLVAVSPGSNDLNVLAAFASGPTGTYLRLDLVGYFK